MKKLEQLPPNPWLESLQNWEKQLKILIHEKTARQTADAPAPTAISPALTAISPAPTSPRIYVSTSHNTAQYYLSDKNNKRKRKYISKKEINNIKKIAQQDYDLQVLQALEKEHRQIEKFLASYQKQNAADIYKKLPAARQALITPLTLPTADYARTWQEIEYHRKPFVVGTTTEYYTQKGERVRSKSEILIANTLAQHKIPYRYEYPVRLQNYTAHPDFLCLNPRTRIEFLWEHLGRLDDPSYLAENLPKLLQYEKSGYFPGHHLILTFETAALPLSVKQIKNVIKEYLT